MKEYNITAQIYKKHDEYRQTIFTNEVVHADDKHHAILLYKLNLDPEYSVLKIYSVEEISQEAA
jgi:hypothetical protein